jgi:hypothetical protein
MSRDSVGPGTITNGEKRSVLFRPLVRWHVILLYVQAVVICPGGQIYCYYS